MYGIMIVLGFIGQWLWQNWLSDRVQLGISAVHVPVLTVFIKGFSG